MGKDQKNGLNVGTQGMAGKETIGVAVGRWRLAPRIFFNAALLSFCGASHAADPDSGGAPPAAVGVPCQIGAPFWAPPAATAEELPWASVWLGHFSGGRHFEDLNGQTFVDWRDDKVCFPSRRECQAWIAFLRRAYDRPEGYWTCLQLR